MPKSPQSFGPERRLKKRQDFLRVQGAKTKFRSRHFIVAVAESRVLVGNRRPIPRLGITVTTKVDKRSARRNRLKRRVREFFRQQTDLPARAFDIVVIALDGSVALTYDEVCAELTTNFRRAGLLRGQR